MKLSIIIVNWKVRDLLRDCLRSVARETRRDVEIFVVDNASGDGSVEMLAREFPQVRVIANPDNRGFAHANNQAFALSQGEFVLLLNPDTVVLDQAIDRALAILEERPDVDALGCRLLNPDGTLQRWTAGHFPTLWRAASHYLFLNRLLPLAPRSFYLESDVDHDLEVDWLCGAFLLLRRAALDGRLFDESFFMYGEDMDLCRRLKANGAKILYTPSVSILHYHGASMRRQDDAAVLRSSLKGIRTFFSRRHGRLARVAFDAITVAGFLLRWTLYRLMAVMRPGRGFAEKAHSSRRYLWLAVQVMAGK